MTQPVDSDDATPADETPEADAATADDGGASEAQTSPRPVLVEVASALLIVGGITAVVGWLGALLLGVIALDTAPQATAGLPAVIYLGLNLVAVATGLTIRRGRHWRLCINVVAFSIVVYLTEIGRPIALFFLTLDLVAFYALVQHRAWFRAQAASKSDAA